MDLIWDELDAAGWATGLGMASLVPLQQTWGYGVAAAQRGAGVRRCLIRLAGRDAGLAQVLDRGPLRVVLRGPVWFGDVGQIERRRALRRLARTARATIATPGEAVAGIGLLPLITPRHHALWDLRPDALGLRAGLHPKWRNRLVAAERAGVRILTGSRAALAHLIAAEAAARSARGYRALPPDFARAVIDAAPDDWRVFHSHAGDAVGAAMAFLVQGRAASYQIGWAGAEARAAGAHQVMLWQAALALRAEGVGCLDLGDVNTEAAMGLARFKLGTGAALVGLGATMAVLPA